MVSPGDGKLLAVDEPSEGFDRVRSELREIVRVAAELTERLAALDVLAASARPSTASTQKVLLTPEQAAQALGISRSQVYLLIKANDLRSLKLGSSRRVSRQAIDEFVADLEERQTASRD